MSSRCLHGGASEATVADPGCAPPAQEVFRLEEETGLPVDWINMRADQPLLVVDLKANHAELREVIERFGRTCPLANGDLCPASGHCGDADDGNTYKLLSVQRVQHRTRQSRIALD